MQQTTAITAFIFQDGNAVIDTTGSLFRKEDADNEFFALIEVDTGNALGVRNASKVPDHPICALPPKNKDNQKWKYCIPESSVRITSLIISLF